MKEKITDRSREDITIRKATSVDLEEILPVYDKARSHMRGSGNMTQWVNGYPSKEDLSRDIAKGNLYVGENENGRIVLAFAFIIGDDPTYREIDGKWLRDDPYGTIHRIASDGSGRRMLEKSIEFCRSLQPDIRIDTHKDNGPMLQALERAGFVRCGVIICADGTPREAFQIAME